MGFNENLQKYVVSVEKTAVPVAWHYNRRVDMFDTAEQKQKFEVGVSFQYVKLEESDVEGDTNVKSSSLWNIDEDIFYAFSTKSEATFLSSLTIYSVIAAVALSLATF